VRCISKDDESSSANKAVKQEMCTCTCYKFNTTQTAFKQTPPGIHIFLTVVMPRGLDWVRAIMFTLAML
jgi:hypothetical protein